jgi:glycosyltransferase involved in cell wall biosynthesis
MKIEPLVSIITPSYNQAEFLEETILSVLNQTYKNTEYIIIDGGSTDGSTEIIKKYQDLISYWVSEKDQGQADAINKGFAKSKGEFLCWVNSDDILYPDFVARRIKEFDLNTGVSMIYGDVDQGWDKNKPTLRKGCQQTFEEMLRTCVIRIPQMSAMWSRHVYEKIGGLNTQLNVLLDWEYFFRIAEKDPILYQPGSVAFFRQHKNSKSVKYNSSWVAEIEECYLDFFSKYNKYDTLKKEALVSMFLFCAKLCLQDKEVHKAEGYKNKAKNEDFILFFKKRIYDFILKTLSGTKTIMMTR